MQTKQKKWWQRALAMMLSLALVLSSFLAGGMPVSYAAEEGGPSDGIYVSNTGDDTTGDGSQGNPYATLNKAYAVVNDGGTIYLLDDNTLFLGSNGRFPDFNQNKNITITTDLEGNANVPAVIRRGAIGGVGTGTLLSLSAGQLTLKDIIIDGSIDDKIANGRIINVSGSTSKLIIEEGTVFRNNNSAYAGSAVFLDSKGVVEMKAGEIRENKHGTGAAVLIRNGAEFRMTGGIITDNTGGGIDLESGKLTLSGEARITGNTIVVSGKQTDRNVHLKSTNLLNLDGNFTGEAGITAETRMKAGEKFGEATDEVMGIENLIADSGPLLASYREGNNDLVWRLFKNEISQPSTNGEIMGTNPTLKGVTEPFAKVAIKIVSAVDSSIVITEERTADENGNWDLTVDKALSTGEYTINVIANKNKTQSDTVTRQFVVPVSNQVIPGGIDPSKLSLWVKADEGAQKDSNGNLTDWLDQTNKNIFTIQKETKPDASSGVPMLELSKVNFNPSVKFDGYSYITGNQSINMLEAYTVAMWNGNTGGPNGQYSKGTVLSPTKTSDKADYYFWNAVPNLNGLYSGTGNYNVTTAPKDNVYNFWNATQNIYRKDGSNTGTVSGDTFNIKGIPQIGKRNEFTETRQMGNMNGNIAEIIALNAKATSEERDKVDSYLAVKYGITLNNGESNYVDTAGTPVWKVDTMYKNNIAGIARDDAESLHQKQSHSINDGIQVLIGLDTLVDSNAANKGELTDKQYLMWGDNGAALKFTQPVGNLSMNHTERIWKVQNTGNIGEVNIAIPKELVPQATKLLVADDSNFTSVTSYPMENTVEVTGTEYYVTKAVLANGQYFTFAADVPVPQSIKVEEVTVDPSQIKVLFDKEIKLTAPNEKGFTVTVGTEIITLSDADIQVDPTNPKQLLITLPAGTDTTGKLVKVEYDGQGNLTGTHNVPVNKFEKDVINVDKTALQNKVDEVKMLEEGNYTPDSWLELQEALKEAERVLKDPDVTQEQVEAALENLKQAEQDLVLVKPVPTTAVLEQSKDGNKIAVEFNKTITLTNLTGFTIHIEGVEMTPTGYEVVGDKLVLTFPGNPDVTDKAVKVKYDGTGNLQGTNGTAIEQFELPVEDSYSSAFQITQPDAVTAKPQPTIGGKVDVTTTPSTVTIVLKNDKDEPLLVDVAATVDPSTGEWTFTPPTDLPDGTYTVIATATNGQQTVTKKHTFTVATTPIVNKVPLQQKVEEAKNLVAGEYTPASWSNYQTALNKAKEILAKPNATLEEVDKALAALTGAQNALVKIGKGLGTLTPSTGTLSPSFQTGVTDYTMTVEYPTSVIDFTAIPVEAGATVTTTVNGQPGAIGQIPLQVGENIIVISVKDANGNVRQYTIKVYRDAYTGGGSWTPNPTQPVTPTPTPGDTKTKIRVELEIDGEKPLEKTTVEIERTKHANGDITDFVALTEANAKEAVAKAKEIGNNIARIVLPDVNDEVKEAKVEIPKESLKLLRENGLSLEISSENGHIAIPVSSMEGIDDNFYFRLVPVKKESERQAIEERARAERVVRETLQSNDVHVVARPMTIETNMPSRPVQVTLPLKGVKIPTGAAEREAFLKQLAVFIEHSDGEKKVVIPEVVTMAKDELGLRFTVEKFSTFTIIQVNKKEETKPPLEVKEHEAYIKGFPDGTFGPEKNVTRAQVATMIARILGYTDGPVNTAPFKDIPSDHYAAGAIAFVKERGIMNGDVNGNFRASENITRAQMATVVANYKQLSIKENVAITFNDTKGHWAQWIIEANRAAGIINGRQDGSFAPDEHLTRAQAVVMMNRMFERGPLQGVTTPSFPDVKATHWAFDDIEEAAKSHEYFMDEDENEQLSK